MMVVIRMKAYFTLLLSATCFGSLYRSHLEAEVLFTEEGEIYYSQNCCRLRDLALHIENIIIKIIQYALK